MFDSEQTLTNRLYDAIDLAIDFATLGEYGLEPVGSTPEGCEAGRTRPMPIADRQTFTEVLFPNRFRGPSPTSTTANLPGANVSSRRAPTEAPCSGRSRAAKAAAPRGSGPKLARKRGSRGASLAVSADGAA